MALTTCTPTGIVGAKTVAWGDTTCNALRALYDLWTLAQGGHTDAEAAQIFRRLGPVSSYPRSWMFPKQPSSETEWDDDDALTHLGRLVVGPDKAYGVGTTAWAAAVNDAETTPDLGRTPYWTRHVKVVMRFGLRPSHQTQNAA